MVSTDQGLNLGGSCRPIQTKTPYTPFTREGSQVRSLHRPPEFPLKINTLTLKHQQFVQTVIIMRRMIMSVLVAIW